MSIIIAILVFGIIVLLHEFGHYISARRCGVLVEEFAIGMGPKIYSFQKGDTLYSIRLLPLGGFCKMLGDEAESTDSRSFTNKTMGQRAIILSSGALMNFILAFVLFAGIALLNGFYVPAVRAVLPGSPAEVAGLQIGDRVTKINGSGINIFEDWIYALSTIDGRPMDIEYKRNGQLYSSTITPYRDETTGEYKIGYTPDVALGLFEKPAEGFKRAGFIEALSNGFYKILFYIKVTITGVIRLFTFKMNVSEMSGVIGVVSVINDAYTTTIAQSILSMILTMLNLCAVLSANLGVFNLLPIPGLDGGRLVFVGLEFIRKKPISPEREGFVHFMGFVFLILLAVVIAYSDIRKIV